MHLKRGILQVYILVIIMISIPVLAKNNVAPDDGLGTPSSFNLDSFDWQHGDLSSVPNDQLDFDQISKFNRLGELKADQLAFKKKDGSVNIDKIPKEKWSSLNQVEKDKALTQLGRGEDVETAQDDSETQVTSFDDGFSLDAIKFIRVGDVRVNDGAGIAYRNGILSVDKASKIEIKDGLLTNVENFQGSFIEFSVGSAEDVINGCVTARNVKNSKFGITDTSIEINPEQVKGKIIPANNPTKYPKIFQNNFCKKYES